MTARIFVFVLTNGDNNANITTASPKTVGGCPSIKHISFFGGNLYYLSLQIV